VDETNFMEVLEKFFFFFFSIFETSVFYEGFLLFYFPFFSFLDDFYFTMEATPKPIDNKKQQNGTKKEQKIIVMETTSQNHKSDLLETKHCNSRFENVEVGFLDELVCLDCCINVFQ